MCRHVASDEFYDAIKAMISPHHCRKLTSAKMQKEYGELEYKCFNTGQGIVYCSFSGLYNEDVCVTSVESSDYAFFAFNTGNPMHMKTLSNNQEVHFSQNLCYCGTMHQGHHACGMYTKGKRYASHFIILENGLFENFSEECSLEKKVCTPCHHTGDYFSIDRTSAISTKQSLLLSELSHASAAHGSLQELFLESKLLELLHTSFQEHASLPLSLHEEISLTQDDIKALQKAKILLLNNLQNPFSIKELARKAAINEFKLKKGFKHLFGNTIFGTLQEERLKEAKALLQRNDICVAEAATLVGYTSLSHFSKIFKEKYGVLPMALKANKKFY